MDILLVDLKLPRMSGLDLLKRVTELYPQISVLVLTQYGTSLQQENRLLREQLKAQVVRP